ncbi:hypothetical protein Naga_100083g11 [Nannochloropsis gaditana]|uniref:Uncharacterized protein n=1 Tax=Nannochloropsis gaditana TaxID=72520 RepID=W7U943_9STRA|nr:hypothetical protein Naga_100083g11 [Nannochloropsis gaditana]
MFTHLLSTTRSHRDRFRPQQKDDAVAAALLPGIHQIVSRSLATLLLQYFKGNPSLHTYVPRDNHAPFSAKS